MRIYGRKDELSTIRVMQVVTAENTGREIGLISFKYKAIRGYFATIQCKCRANEFINRILKDKAICTFLFTL